MIGFNGLGAYIQEQLYIFTVIVALVGAFLVGVTRLVGKRFKLSAATVTWICRVIVVVTALVCVALIAVSFEY